MKKQNGTIGIRISQEQKKAVIQLVKDRKLRNLSAVVRVALEEFLEKQ